MARAIDLYSTILGLPESTKSEYNGYKELKDVLNYMGVMVKRNEVPYVYVIIPPAKKKPSVQYGFIGKEYYVPKNWRDCLYEDLETGHYYIITPLSEQQANIRRLTQSWIAFQVTGLRDGLISRFVEKNNNVVKRQLEVLHHTGSFIELIKRVGINSALDALAVNEKPIKIKNIKDVQTIKYSGNVFYNERIGSACQLDID